MFRIAIVGGGPGGLISGHLLQRKVPDLTDVTIFESDARLGGKILTNRFHTAPVNYEAGVAELYGYWHLGEDPLHQIVNELGLGTVALSGSTVVLDDCIMRGMGDVRRHFGKETVKQIKSFRRRATKSLSPKQYYNAGWPEDNGHAWYRRSFASLLNRVKDRNARRYLAVAAHSDLAAEPHEVNGLFGVENVLMDDPRYVSLYSLRGGIETLPQALVDASRAKIRRESPVKRVEKAAAGKYRVTWRHRGEENYEMFDAVIVALPNYWLPTIEWGGSLLSNAMRAHHSYYDTPAHYLRVTALFRKPYWRNTINDSYFQLGAFGGCCVYDEGAKLGVESHGVLSWLLGGDSAMMMSNWSDERLIQAALDSLPRSLRPDAGEFLEGSVNRWVGTVSAQPGGPRLRDVEARHRPEPKDHPNLLVVGDYLFDSTINGATDSADIATKIVAKAVQKRYGAGAIAIKSKSNKDGLSNGYFKHYNGSRKYENSFKDYFDAEYVVDLIETVWHCRPPYTLLDCGSASGLTITEFQKHGVEASGIENDAGIHCQTPPALRSRNHLGDVRKLPFPDQSFDFVYETCLCYVPEADIDQAINELRRVTRKGLFFGSISKGYRKRVIRKHWLKDGVAIFETQNDWAQRFLRAGWLPAVTDWKVRDTVWKIERKANDGKPWYRTADIMQFCFFSPGPPKEVKEKEKVNGIHEARLLLPTPQLHMEASAGGRPR